MNFLSVRHLPSPKLCIFQFHQQYNGQKPLPKCVTALIYWFTCDICKWNSHSLAFLLTSWIWASSSLVKPMGRGAVVVISMMYKSVLRLLHTLPILSQRQPRTRRLKRRVSRPRLIWKKKKIFHEKIGFNFCHMICN